MNTKLATINIRGLSTLLKKRYLSQFLTDNQIDIACLQEISNPFNDFPNSSYNYILNKGDFGLGTAIVFKEHLKPTRIEKDPSGRIIKITFKEYSIINIYGYPQGKDHNPEKRLRVFTTILPIYIKSNENTIIMGDFNTAASKDEPGNYMWQLNKFLKDLRYNDCDSLCNKGKKTFTFIGSSGKTRIDRIYIPDKLKKKILDCTYVDYVQSDHRAVIVKTNLANLINKKISSPYWKMNVKVIEEEDYEINVKHLLNSCVIEKTPNISILQWWDTIFKPRLKEMTIKYCTIRNRNIKLQKNFTSKCLEQLSEEIINGKDRYDEYSNFKKQEAELFENKGQSLLIKGRLKGQVQNEQSSIAHTINEMKRNESRTIDELENKLGDIKKLEWEKQNIVYDFYKDIFKIETKNSEPTMYNINPRIKLDSNENRRLIDNIHISEIKSAIDDLNDGKSPGLDGIPIEFYKAYWKELKEILLELFCFILHSNTMSTSQKTSAVTLIHKGKKREKLENWRPISLLCVDYKILAKLITNRLKPVLGRLINPYQTAGLQGRSITENLCNIRNTLINYSNSKAAILSLDFAKAYDRVDRHLIYKVMRIFNFPETFIK